MAQINLEVRCLARLTSGINNTGNLKAQIIVIGKLDYNVDHGAT